MSTVCFCLFWLRTKCYYHMQSCVFLCSLHNVLLKNVILFIFGKQPLKRRFIVVTYNGGSNGQGYTKHIKDRSTGTEGYLEYTKENGKGKVNQLDKGNKKYYTITNQDMRIIQSQKTTEYSWEPKQKQANGAQNYRIDPVPRTSKKQQEQN